MRYLLMFIPLLIGTVAPANADCSVADKSFAAFIQAFKNDRAFQLTRIDNPLPWTSTEPDANGKMASQQRNVSVQALSQRSISIIRGNDRAAELSGGEGQLCEQGPSKGLAPPSRNTHAIPMFTPTNTSSCCAMAAGNCKRCRPRAANAARGRPKQSPVGCRHAHG